MEDLFTINNLVALLTLTTLEIVLGIDNIVFIAIVAGKLPPEQRDRARVVGLSLAIITRLMLLGTLSFLASLTDSIFEVAGHGFSIRDLILVGGGLFLIWKAGKEIYHKIAAIPEKELALKEANTFAGVICQILIIDIIFSLDSVITAVGMTNNIPVMASAIILAVVVMLACSKWIVEFIDQNPTVKMLALAFLVLVGAVLIIEGFGLHFDKGYIYGAMAFSLVVEVLNLQSARKVKA